MPKIKPHFGSKLNPERPQTVVRLKGPLNSAHASGSLADVLTVSQTRSGHYMKTHANPTDRQTPDQLAVRMMMTFLVAQWKLLSAADMATWFDQATSRKIANYHAYISTNQQRRMPTRTPSKVDPPTEGHSAVAAPLINAFGNPGTASVAIKAAAPVWTWGALTARSLTSGFTPTAVDVIRIYTPSVAGWQWWTDSPLAPATYYYRHMGFNADGQHGPWSLEGTAIVT